MGDDCKVLFVEDEDADVTLARRELARNGLDIEWRRVATESELRSSLADFRPDIVLCDYRLPGYSGRAALELVRLLRPSTPVLFVSGTIGDDIAITCLTYGATDYLLKSNLQRLGPAVRRAVTDARERERMQEVEQARRRLAEILDVSGDMVVMSDASGRITFANDAACRLLGESRQQLLGSKWEATYVPRPRERIRHDAMQTATQHGSWQGEIAIATRSGATIATSQVVTAHKDSEGRVRFFSTVGRDLRDRKAFEARIHQLAHYDTLTGLPNLAHVDDLVRRSIARARRSNRAIALVTVNLDGFRLVDEGFGRASGDDVLRSVSRVLRIAARERDTVARVGPDEFLVILSDLADSVEAAGLVQRILDSIAMPRSLAGQDLQITASAGIAMYPNDGDDFETLLRNASAAMHDVKARSHNGLQFHAGEVGQHAQRRLRLETGLRNAIQHHDLILHYQPQFDIRSGRACGVEALTRWFRADGEAIAPSVFIPLAEQTGLIVALGAWALQEACTMVAAWRGADEEPPILCINVSTHQIRDEFSAAIARVIELTGFPAERLELEITESVLIADAELVLHCLAQWKRLGVRVAVDDFGTGYSSLSYLSRLPVDRLKMDKSLIHSMTSEPRDAAIVRAVIALGQELGFAVLAEGVETEEQLEMLTDMGCQQVQGYLLAPPACATEARALLQRRWGARRTLIPCTARASTARLHAS